MLRERYKEATKKQEGIESENVEVKVQPATWT